MTKLDINSKNNELINYYSKLIDYKNKYLNQYPDDYYSLALFCINEKNNIKDGLKILKEGEKFGCLNSLMYLGSLYYEGLMVKIDKEKAVRYYEKAALLDNESCIDFVSHCYLTEIVPFGNLRSLNILKKGKDLNIRNSILCLAKYHEDPSSLNFNHELSFKYKVMCLDEDNTEEVKELALDYLRRTTSTGIYNKQMVELFKIAAKKKDLDSINILAFFYNKGNIVKKDLTKSLEYYNRALLLGNLLAKKEIQILENIINKSRI